MTRINVIPPEKLTDQHLLAEYRELPRVFPLAKKAISKGIVLGPFRYTLGTGHVRFFYSRTDYLADRHRGLTAELLDRGYTLTQREPLARLPGCGTSQWFPGVCDVETNLGRLREKLLSPPRPDFYTHRGVVVGPDFYSWSPR